MIGLTIVEALPRSTPPCPCARVNDASNHFLGKGAFSPSSQILALRVYNVPPVSTISKLRLLGAGNLYQVPPTMRVCTGERCRRPILGEGGLHPHSQILAICVYNVLIVSTIRKLRLLGAYGVYKLHMPVCTGERFQQPFFWGRGPSPAFANIATSRLQHADSVYN